MIGSYSNSQQQALLAPFYFNSALSYYMPQNALFQQMQQNPNFIFSLPFNGGMQFFPQPQSPTQPNTPMFLNNQQVVNAQPFVVNGQVQNMMSGGVLPFQNLDPQSLALYFQNFPANLINQDNIQIPQQDNNQCNSEISLQALIKNDSTVSNQALQQETNLTLTQAQCSILSEPEQSNTPYHICKNISQKQSSPQIKPVEARLVQSPISIKSERSSKKQQQVANADMHSPQKNNNEPEKIKSSSLILDRNMEEASSGSQCEHNNTATELKISSNQNSSKFILIKGRKSISQENLSSTQRNSNASDLDQKPLQEEEEEEEEQINRISQEFLNQQEEEANLLESEEEISLHQDNFLNKEKPIDNKSRNFSKNLLKSFFKYTQLVNKDNKRFLFNFKRYISSNKTNNELIIKILTNSPYHSYFIEFLGQPATDWIVSSKVQNVEEQHKFLELCRSGEISALKKRNHNKKKSLFSLRKQ